METREAYEAIRRAIASDPRRRLVKSSYREDVFGNFIVAFDQDGEPRSLVNDRGELVLYKDLSGRENGTTLLRSLEDVDERAMLRAVAL